MNCNVLREKAYVNLISSTQSYGDIPAIQLGLEQTCV